MDIFSFDWFKFSCDWSEFSFVDINGESTWKKRKWDGFNS
jgi:hypothetical protein